MASKAAIELRRWRWYRRWSQKRTADYLGLSGSMVKKLENGHRKPGLATAFRIQKKTRIRAGRWLEDFNAASYLASHYPKQ